jgi:hypothetical protein
LVVVVAGLSGLAGGTGDGVARGIRPIIARRNAEHIWW